MSIPSKLPWDADVAGSWTLSLVGRIPTTFLYQLKTSNLWYNPDSLLFSNVFLLSFFLKHKVYAILIRI